jgi:hypothetical protein
MLRQIKGSQRLPRLLAFKVTGTGTAAIGEGSQDATLTDNGVGDYTLTFRTAFLRAPVVVASSLTALAYCEVSASVAASCRILTKKTLDNSAIDAVFFALVLGWDTADTY